MRQQSELAPSTLTLSEKAEIERMGTDFFLHAADTDGRTVRWASVTASGVLGPEQQAAVPAHSPSLGPWVALASKDAPFDRVLIFFGVPADSDPNALELKVLGVPFSGTGDAGAAGTPVSLGNLPSPASSLRLAVGSGAAGLHAGVAFGLSGKETLTFLVVDGAGAKVGAPQTVGGGADALDFKCLRVTSAFGGSSDLVLSYVRQAAESDPSPAWRFVSVDGQGLLGGTTMMGLSAARASCPTMALPSDGTIALAWNDPAHAWFVDWPPNVSELFPREVAAAATQPGGQLPPVAAVAALGPKDFGILYDRQKGGTLHVVDAMGVATQDDLSLPAHASNVGTLSSLPVGTSLYATYADYDSASASSGRRQWLRIACE